MSLKGNLDERLTHFANGGTGDVSRACREAQAEIGRLRTAFRVNMLRLGHSDDDISRVLDAGPSVIALKIPAAVP